MVVKTPNVLLYNLAFTAKALEGQMLGGRVRPIRKIVFFFNSLGFFNRFRSHKFSKTPPLYFAYIYYTIYAKKSHRI